MPYITQDLRKIVDPGIQKAVDFINETLMTAERKADILTSLLVCVHQERIPHVGHDSHLPIETVYVYDLVKEILQHVAADERNGVLNYCVSRILWLTIFKDGVRYNKIQFAIEVLGRTRDKVYFGTTKALIDCVTMELYRVVAVPYEKIKEAQNGSVFDVQ